jgi:hypothetical protein
VHETAALCPLASFRSTWRDPADERLRHKMSYVTQRALQEGWG